VSILLVEVHDQVLGFDGPDELHAPFGIAGRVAHETFGCVRLQRPVERVLVEFERGGDVAVRVEPIGLDRVVRALFDERRNVRDDVPVAHEARQVDLRHGPQRRLRRRRLASRKRQRQTTHHQYSEDSFHNIPGL
jgi:hypothetical protein